MQRLEKIDAADGVYEIDVTARFKALGDMLVLIEEGNRVSGKMRFHGYHRQEAFGVAPSGRHIWWTGMPIFTFDGGKVRDLYVLGDIYGLIERMRSA